MCRPVLQILTLFQTKTCHFPHRFSDLTSKIHTSFQTWRRSQNATYLFKKANYIIITEMRTPTKNIFLKIHFEFAYYGFISYSFRTNRQICSYTTVAPLKTIPDSRPKRRKNLTLWGGTYLNGLYRDVYPPPPRNTCHKQRL